jgi:hypothetical protein
VNKFQDISLLKEDDKNNNSAITITEGESIEGKEWYHHWIKVPGDKRLANM